MEGMRRGKIEATAPSTTPELNNPRRRNITRLAHAVELLEATERKARVNGGKEKKPFKPQRLPPYQENTVGPKTRNITTLVHTVGIKEKKRRSSNV